MSESTPSWYCVYTHPKQEFYAAEHLRRQRFEVFLPTIIVKPLRRRQSVIRPYFTRYLFVSFDVMQDNWRPIWSTNGVKSLFSSNPYAPIAIPGQTILTLRQQIEEYEIRQGYCVDVIRPGTIARVLNGSLKGHEAPCISNEKGRVKLLMMIFNRGVVVEFVRADVEAVR
jgi:transcriptional antiterminator RfaH